MAFHMERVSMKKEEVMSIGDRRHRDSAISELCRQTVLTVITVIDSGEDFVYSATVQNP